MNADESGWFTTATSSWTDWDAAQLVAAKGNERVSVVIPARNEAATIEGIVAAIRRELMEAYRSSTNSS